METLVFDIGKTNKKAFIFTEDHQEVWKEYARFEESQDEEGFPCDDLAAIEAWINHILETTLSKKKFSIKAINFSTYGASWVHIDKSGQVITPLYNYLKPYPEELLADFYTKYGDQLKLARETASPPLAMLNSGLQLYWLKYRQPEVFKRIRWSLHFPQYLSYRLTGLPLSDYTSIGCHTTLWNFERQDYHSWVYAEGLDQLLAPIVMTNTSISRLLLGRKVKIGVGIHDSSAALLPYLMSDKKPFLLISTGTWSISLNPFNNDSLDSEELQADCLSFLQIDGRPVRAARLFLGAEYKLQIHQLQAYFGTEKDAHKYVKFDEKTYAKTNRSRYYFSFEYLTTPWKQPKKSRLDKFDGFKEAYYQLIKELVELQVVAARLAIGKTSINKLYIDGGFADNELYVQMMARHFRGVKLRTTQSPLGSSLGAAMAVKEKPLAKGFLKKNYALRKIQLSLKPGNND